MATEQAERIGKKNNMTNFNLIIINIILFYYKCNKSILVFIISISISYLGSCYSLGEDSSSTVIDQTFEGHKDEKH